MQIVTATFPARQRLGQTSLLRLGFRNTGRRTVPALAVTFSLGGPEGQDSGLPFGYRDRQPGIAQPDRPVWVLAEHFPKLAGSSVSAGAETSSAKTFDFGPLKPGQTVEAVWKLSAVKKGNYTVLYVVDAGLTGEARAVTGGGVPTGGSFAANITRATPNTIVTDNGEVVEIHKHKRRGG